MEIEDIQMFPRICRIGEELIQNPIMKKLNTNSSSNNGGLGDNNDGNRLNRWHHNHHSSRIIRVSRATGGKDRHSKVWTSKGLRDRRVRLSVPTALQFYDLQDRLGYDQPSKAVEWLIKAAADSISELPSLDTSNFPGDDNEKFATPKPNPNPDPTGSCSSNSETSKNSGLSLSRSEIREKARERARERTAKEKEKEKVNDNSHASFTELLTRSVNGPDPARQWMDHSPTVHHVATMEYLSSGLILGSGQFPHQTVTTPPFNSISDHHHHHHHHPEFSFVPDLLISPGGGGGCGGGAGSYSLDFNISSSGGAATAAAAGLGGFSRGTLQSNSPNQQSFFNNPQRFSSAPVFFGSLPVEDQNHNHNHHFQLYYDNGCRSSDQKGKDRS